MFMYTGGEGHVESRYRGTLFLLRDGKAILIEITDGYISQGIGTFRDDVLNKLIKAIAPMSTGFLAGQHPNDADEVFVYFMDEWPPPELVEEATQRAGALKVVPVSDLLDWSRQARAAAE